MIIYRGFLDFESPISHAMILDQRTFGSGKEEFLSYIYMGMTAILVTWTIYMCMQTFVPTFHGCST